jgi:hypothetical protein
MMSPVWCTWTDWDDENPIPHFPHKTEDRPKVKPLFPACAAAARHCLCLTAFATIRNIKL